MEIKEAIKFLKKHNYFVKSLNEGIDINYENKTISYNDTHEYNVDTSLENNPVYDTEMFPGVNIWSIFKRNKHDISDGNPLVYALKKEKDWTFKTENDKEKILEQFNKIADKFVKMNNFDLTILIPSSNYLNKYIANTISSKCDEPVEILEDVVCKLTTEEVEDIVLDFNSKFRLFYKENFDFAFRSLSKYLDKMNEEKNGIFTRHFIKDQEMRNVLDLTLKLSDDKYAEYANVINGKNILIIDDTISRGQSIKEMVNIIKTSYSPKNISVLTLLSKLG